MADVRHLSNLKFFDFFKGVRRGGYLAAGRAQVRTTLNQDMAGRRRGIEATLVFNPCGDIMTSDAVWGELWRSHRPLAGVTLECHSPTASPKAPYQAKIAAAEDRSRGR